QCVSTRTACWASVLTLSRLPGCGVRDGGVDLLVSVGSRGDLLRRLLRDLLDLLQRVFPLVLEVVDRAGQVAGSGLVVAEAVHALLRRADLVADRGQLARQRPQRRDVDLEAVCHVKP